MTRQPRRVLHVIPAVAPRYGGPSQTAVRLCRALAACGLEVTLATTDADGPGRLDVELARPTIHEGARVIFFPRLWSESFKYAPALARWLRQSASDWDLLHVHALFSHASVAATRACWRRQVPYVLRPLGTLDPWGLARKRWRKRLLMGAVGRRMIERAAFVHFTTESERRLAEPAAPAAQAVVVPLGIDDDLLQARVPSGRDREPVVLSLGRLHPVKNLDGAIAAFHQVAGPGPLDRWRLVVAGDGDRACRAGLMALAAAGPARDRITFAGWLNDDEKRVWLGRAALLLQPSHQESFGVSIVEAMASGVPVVVSHGVNLSSDVAAAGAGWVSGPDDLADTLAAAMQDADARDRAARAGRVLAARFTWTAAAEALVAAYERVWAGAPDGTAAADPGAGHRAAGQRAG